MTTITKSLTDCRNGIANLDLGPDGLTHYQAWANQSAESLSYLFSADAIEYLIQTPRQWVLISTAMPGNRPTISGMITAERTDRLRVFDELINQYNAYQQTWTGVTAHIVAADTNFYLHHEQDFFHADWPTIVASETVRLLVPMQVVRELDKTKRNAKNLPVSDTNPEKIRSRAARTSRMLREIFAPNVDAVTKLPNGVEIELLLDATDHRWLEDPDSEIIDRVAAAKQLIKKPVAMVTHDGGMQFGARVAGLEVVSLFDSEPGNRATEPPS
jgi:hypothetical protein